MKIALLGSASSSLRLAPFGNPEWRIWACSPGTYPLLSRCDAFFELHRWEPGVIGKARDPEALVLAGVRRLDGQAVARLDARAGVRRSRLEVAALRGSLPRWGSYFWTSSLAYMLAMAMDEIIAERARRKASGMSEVDLEAASKTDMVGLWGVDMSATEEYGYQRAGCQFFLCMANMLGIGVYVPPESDLLRPLPPYGLVESSHWHIKNLVRRHELEARRDGMKASMEAASKNVQFLDGAIDDLKYQMDTWGGDRHGIAPSTELAVMMCRPAAPASTTPAPIEEVAQQRTGRALARKGAALGAEPGTADRRLLLRGGRAALRR
jgi:hypothetical protein